MPVRSLTQSVLRWPDPEQVLFAAQRWAESLQAVRSSLRAVGVFGSYGRGTAGVGSDLDLLLLDEAAQGPQQLRLLQWPLEHLPLSCDALVLTPDEWHTLQQSGSRMADAMRTDLRWLIPPAPGPTSPPSSSPPRPFPPAGEH